MPRAGPPALLRELLTEERDAGAPFDEAWARSLAPSMRHAPGRDLEGWREAFAATRTAWEGAYTADAPTPLEEALAACARDPPPRRVASSGAVG